MAQLRRKTLRPAAESVASDSMTRRPSVVAASFIGATMLRSSLALRCVKNSTM